MEYDAYDVLLKCLLLANIKRRCWTLQVVEHDEVISWFTQMMCTMFTFHRCPELQSNDIHALYDKHQKESYSLFSISFLITFSAIVVGIIDIYNLYISFILC